MRTAPTSYFHIFAFVLLCVMTTSLWAETVYVDAGATGNGTGESWLHAYTDLQDAVAESNSNPGTQYQVWVAAGEYIPGSERSDSFRIERNNVQLYGGFPSGGGSWEERDWAANRTTLSGDINDSGTLSGNAYHVLWLDGENGGIITSETVLDGFIITGGNADGNQSHSAGAGLHCAGALEGNECSPALRNLIFIGNSALSGAGMYNGAGNKGISRPTLTNVIFVGNFAEEYGAAIYNNGSHEGVSSPELTNVTISGNNASLGSAIFTTGVAWDVVPITSKPKVRNSIIWGNSHPAIINDSAITDIGYSLVKGCNPGGSWNSMCGTDDGGNLPDADPQFVSPPVPESAPSLTGNLRLQADSPAIAQGNNGLNSMAVDLAGISRLLGSAIDLGAYEFPVADCPNDGVLYVDRTASTAGDGLGWATAFRSLQDALGVQEACDIHVAAGTYMPTYDPTYRRASFTIRHDGVRVFGGFPPGGGNREERDWLTYPTILSGDINNSETLVGNAYKVVRVFGGDHGSITGATEIDGFTITGGNADDSLNHSTGGGLACSASGSGNECSPALSNIRFRENFALNGGGMFNGANSSASSKPVLTNVVFENNTAGSGGGMANRALGGLSILSNSSPVLVNVIFHGNSADSGGGMYNLASESVGGTSSPILTNVIFTGNSADSGSALSANATGSPQIRNSIIWGNDAPVINANSNLEIKHSLAEGCKPGGNWNVNCGSDGGGNLADANPLFADAAELDFRSLPGSPALFAGDATFAAGMDTDLAGNPRTVDGQIDMGAYQSPGFTLAITPESQSAPLGQLYDPINVSAIARSDTGFPEPGSYPMAGGQVTISYPASGPTVSFPDQAGNPFALPLNANGQAETSAPSAVGESGEFAIEFSATGAQTTLAQMSNLGVFTVTAAVAEGQGQISPSQQVVTQGDNASFVATPEANWHIVSVTGDTCEPVNQGGDVWQANDIAQDCDVLAVFAPVVFSDRFESK